MGKKIIVTEKPSVAKVYSQVLGVKSSVKTDGYIENEEYIITWCVGHLVSLEYPKKYDPNLEKWKMETLPFLPKEYKYGIIKDVAKQFNIIKKLYNRPDIDCIYYAGDPAREGIYIQMLVRQEAGHNPSAKELVVWIDSQTADEIKRGIREARPLSEYKKLSDSGYARAIEDYALGINFSRVFTLKYRSLLQDIRRPISIGRVMTCVLGMVVKREREIENFVSTKFYKIQSHINVNGDDIVASWKAAESNSLFAEDKLYNESGFRKREDAEEFINNLGSNLIIEDVKAEESKKYAPLLFNLAELQSTCSRIFKISPDKTLEIAQTLYEKRLTTYPRTDARVLSSAIAKEIDVNLKGLITYNQEIGSLIQGVVNKYDVRKIGNSKYTDDSKIADHYAIIPTGQNIGAVSSLSKDEYKVFDLIVRRFVSVFMPPARYKKVSLIERDEKTGERFYASGSTLIDPGFFRCAGIPTDKGELPESFSNIQKGSTYNGNYSISEGETKPPARYTSGSMILAMENAGNLIENEELRAQIKGNGIGTSATRAEVIKKLVKNAYLNLNNKTQVITPAPFGNCVYEIVNDSVPSLLNPEMTARWEKGLDGIVTGKVTKDEYLEKLNTYIQKVVNYIKTSNTSSDLSERIGKYSKDIKPEKNGGKSSYKITAECYLNVPFEDKDTVKALGARWDSNSTSWYVPKSLDKSAFGKWIGTAESTKAPKKVFLNVPFDDKDEAKSLGARWDTKKKSWYIMSNCDMSKFSKWK